MIPLNDHGQRRLGVGVHLVVADADRLVVREVDAVVREQHIEHVVAFWRPGRRRSVAPVARAGDRAKHADPLHAMAQRVDEPEGHRRLARVALG